MYFTHLYVYIGVDTYNACRDLSALSQSSGFRTEATHPDFMKVGLDLGWGFRF